MGSKDLLDIYSLTIKNLLIEVHIWKLVRDSKGKIKTWELVEANSKALKAWNKSLENIKGKTAEEIFPKSDTVKLFKTIVEKIFSEGKPHEWQSYFPDTNQTLKMVSVPVGEYFISTGEDITAKLHSDHFIEQAHRLDSLGAIAGGVVHDINNLNTIINAQASMIQDKLEDEKLKERAQKIIDAVEKSTSLSKLILSFAKSDEIPNEDINLNEVVTSITELIRGSVDNSIDIKFIEAKDLPLIKANSIHVNQILLNVMTNAIRSMQNKMVSFLLC